jgi:hypothetical protein
MKVTIMRSHPDSWYSGLINEVLHVYPIQNNGFLWFHDQLPILPSDVVFTKDHNGNENVCATRQIGLC